MRRVFLLTLLVLLSGCAVVEKVPRAYAPTIGAAVLIGGLAVTGTLDDVDRAARDASGWVTGDRTSRPETWLLHAAVPPIGCGLAMLAAWAGEACAPAAAGSILYFLVKESIEWGHPNFSPTDGIMDFVAPAITGTMLVRIAGWPEWETDDDATPVSEPGGSFFR